MRCRAGSSTAYGSSFRRGDHIPDSLVLTCAAFPQLGHLVEAKDLEALQLLQKTALQLLHSQYGIPPEPFLLHSAQVCRSQRASSDCEPVKASGDPRRQKRPAMRRGQCPSVWAPCVREVAA